MNYAEIKRAVVDLIGAKGSFLKLVVSGAFLLVFGLNTSGLVKIDIIDLILLMLAIVPWVLPWLESIKVGAFEAKFRELEERVDATKKELDKFKAIYIAMEKDYLTSCEKFNPDAPATELNKLASELRAKAKGLASIDFIFTDLAGTTNQALAFGAACALRDRPQLHAINGVIELLESLVEDKDLKSFRLKTMYRLLMAIDEIAKLDMRNDSHLLASEQRQRIIAIMNRIQNHPRCGHDDVAVLAATIVSKL